MSNQTISQRRELSRLKKYPAFQSNPRHLLGSKPVDRAEKYIALALLDLICVALAVWRCL